MTIASSLAAQVADARKAVRRMKKATPHIFHEWQELQSAKKALRDARVRYARAAQAWKQLAED